jgi:hypothetical protein
MTYLQHYILLLEVLLASLFLSTIISYRKKRSELGQINNEATASEEIKAINVGLISRVLGSVGGLFGIIILIFNMDKVISVLQALFKGRYLGLISDNAYASEGARPDLSGFLPFVAVGVLALMGVSFLVALGTLLLLPDIKENQARIKVADNIVKTFGGFFTGLATTLLK